MKYLPSNPVLNNVNDHTKKEWQRYVRKYNVDLFDVEAVSKEYAHFKYVLEGGGNPFARSGGLVGEPTTDYFLYNNGPYSWPDEDLILDAASRPSDTMAWIPTSKMDGTRYKTVTHVEWIAPRGWDGEAYSTYLAGLDIAPCDYGPGTKWNGFQYQQTYGQFSASTDTYDRLNNFHLNRDYSRSPNFQWATGGNPSMDLPLEYDVDFQIAQLMVHFQNHHEWVLSFGSLSNQDLMEFDGLDTILTNGYVAARLVPGSTGTPSGWANPLIVDGTTLATIAALVSKVRHMVRVLRNRATNRRLQLNQGDMAIRMPLILWQAIAEYIAVNGQVTGISRTEIPSDATDRLNSMLRNRSWEIDGVLVPILIADEMAVVTGTTVTTDVQILTRVLNGLNLLEQSYVDWNTARIPSGLEQETTTGAGGIIRYGWIEENKKCFKYFIEAAGMLVSRSQPNQGVITSFSFTVDSVEEIEATTYSDQYYANFGNPGSIGAGVV